MSAAGLYLQAYAVLHTDSVTGAIRVDPLSMKKYRVSPAAFRRRDTDLPESYSHSETMTMTSTPSTAATSAATMDADADDEAMTTLVVESIPGQRHFVPCSSTGRRYIQFGRAANGANDHVLSSPYMPRYAFRLVSADDGTGAVTVKAAGFDADRMLFLPPEATVLGDADYSTSNRLLLLQGVHRDADQGGFVCDTVSTISVRGHIYDRQGQVCLDREGHRLCAGDALYVGATLFVVSAGPSEHSLSETLVPGMRKLVLDEAMTFS